MKLLETNFDTVIKTDYELYSVKLSELKSLALSWYEGIDLKEFDRRTLYEIDERDENNTRQMKLSGVVCNFFFAYKNNSRFYLMDGFNRLFTDYGDILSLDPSVYIKVITTDLKDHELMLAMFRLNMWKLNVAGFSHNGFRIDDYLDRGFKLFLYSKFGIEIYRRPSHVKYESRTRYTDDVDIINYYFINESEMSGDFKTSYAGVRILMGNENIVNDLKAIIDGNNYLESPFRNYEKFLQGFAMYLAFLRYKGNNTPYQFEYFLEKLYADKTFFKKLQGMSWTDSTRKNIYHFYRDLKLEL